VTLIKLGAFVGSNCNKWSSNLTFLLLLGIHSIKLCSEQTLSSFLAFTEAPESGQTALWFLQTQIDRKLQTHLKKT
jgi:hypothetical protein